MSYSYTTQTLVENELRATTRFASTTVPSLSALTTWIAEESADINRVAGVAYGATSYTTDYDLNGQEVITTKYSPIISVSSLLYSTVDISDSTYPKWESKTEDYDFTVYKDSGEIAFVTSRFSPSDGRKRLRVMYTAGYSTIPESIQLLATKSVALRVLNTLLNQNVNEGNDGGSISVGSIQIVEPASYGVNSYKNLKSDVDRLRKEITQGSGVYRYAQ